MALTPSSSSDSITRPSITVNVQGAEAVFHRTGPLTAEFSVSNRVAARTLSATRGSFPRVIEELCEAEICEHRASFQALHEAIMKQLGHDGPGTTIHTESSVRFERATRWRSGRFQVDGATFHSRTHLATNDAETSDAALASAELSNMLQARIQGIRRLYRRIEVQAMDHAEEQAESGWAAGRRPCAGLENVVR